MDLITTLQQQAGAIQRRIVFPEGDDQRVLTAVRHISDIGFAQPLLIGDESLIKATAKRHNISLEGISIRAPRASEALNTFMATYRQRNPALSPQQTAQACALYDSAIALSSGEVDALVAGAVHTTARVIRVALLQVGLAAGVHTPSSFFMMQIPAGKALPERTLLFADCAINIAPNPAELADIALASARSAQVLLAEPPRVALLSFSSAGSARHVLVDKVREAIKICHQRAPNIIIEGEFQVDTALDAAVAAKKVGHHSEVAGRANVLIFPDLNAGNIGYKLVQYTAGAQAIGPILQGFAHPLSDLSRGATAADIVAAASVLAVSCNTR